MPRRVASYLESDGFDTLNLISSIGAMLLGLSTLPFLWNVWRTLRKRSSLPDAGANPWDGHTLEWHTSSPPPPGNFSEALPPIRSERPVWDANHPDDPNEPHVPRRSARRQVLPVGAATRGGGGDRTAGDGAVTDGPDSS
jgi:cytochrome c oxidase subunit 1